MKSGIEIRKPYLKVIMRKALFGLPLILLFAFPARAQPPEVKPERIITLVFSSNVYGEIEPCG